MDPAETAKDLEVQPSDAEYVQLIHIMKRYGNRHANIKLTGVSISYTNPTWEIFKAISIKRGILIADEVKAEEPLDFVVTEAPAPSGYLSSKPTGTKVTNKKMGKVVFLEQGATTKLPKLKSNQIIVDPYNPSKPASGINHYKVFITDYGRLCRLIV